MTSPDLLEALRSGAVRLVPVMVTTKMWTAGGEAVKTCQGHERDAAALAYNAMLSTSPDHTAAVVALIEGLKAKNERFHACMDKRADKLIEMIDRALAAEAERDALREALAEAIEFADQDAQALTAAGIALVERWRALTQEPNNV